MANLPRNPPNRRMTPRPARGGVTGTRDTVLVVEDDAAIRDALSEAIRGEGYQVETAVNGLEALEKLQWGLRPCLILLDMQMRLMTGWEFRSEQKKDPVLAQVPVVAMTAGRWKESDLSDFTARIEKPIHLANLQQVLRECCERPTLSPPESTS